MCDFMSLPLGFLVIRAMDRDLTAARSLAVSRPETIPGCRDSGQENGNYYKEYLGGILDGL